MKTTYLSAVAMVFVTIAFTNQVLAAGPSFSTLAAGYPSESHPCKETNASGQEKWQNQCAIRLSIAFNSEGTLTVNSSTYAEPLCKHGHARGAQELANWLKSANRIGQPKTYSPASAARSLAGHKGIVFIKDCFRRTDGTAGDHIDLWDGKKLKSVANDLLQRGTEIWFWELH